MKIIFYSLGLPILAFCFYKLFNEVFQEIYNGKEMGSYFRSLGWFYHVKLLTGFLIGWICVFIAERSKGKFINRDSGRRDDDGESNPFEEEREKDEDNEDNKDEDSGEKDEKEAEKPDDVFEVNQKLEAELRKLQEEKKKLEEQLKKSGEKPVSEEDELQDITR